MPETDDILSDAERHALATVTVRGVAPLKVLIVEDDEDSSQLMADIFTLNEIPCVTARNTAIAFEYLNRRESWIGLLITDLRMQPIGGIEFIEQIRQSPNAALPIIIVSGNAEVQDVITAMRLSVVDFLLKPIDVKKLLKLVRHELGIG